MKGWTYSIVTGGLAKPVQLSCPVDVSKSRFADGSIASSSM